MKKRYIIILIVLAVITLAFTLIYVDFKKQSENEVESDYPQQYANEKDITVDIAPIALEHGEIQFNQNKENQRLNKRVKAINTLLNSMPSNNLQMEDVEKVANAKLDALFKNCTIRIIGSEKTNQKHTGYHIQTQRKTGTAPTIHIVLTTDDFMKKSLESGGNQVSESRIDGVTCYVYYNHSKKIEKEKNEETEQYVYEAVFSYKGLNYYVNMDYSGFDYDLKMVETTKEKTSEEVSDFLQELIRTIKK